MSHFRSCFEAYGADYTTTMERFLGNETMYLRILNMLFRDKNLQKLGDALEENRLAQAFEAAHTLKGVAGNLGLTPLYESVCKIVEPLRTGEERTDYRALYEAILSEFQRVHAFRAGLNEEKHI